MGSYIPNNRAEPAKGPMPKLEGKRGPTRAKRARMKDDAIYLGTIDEYLANNPGCAGCGQPSEAFHHIARGNNRSLSSTNTDLGMGGCGDCHSTWDDKGKCPVSKQFAIKFLSVLRRYEQITRTRISPADVAGYMK